MTNRFESLQRIAVSLFGAIIATIFFVSAAVPIVPVA